MQYFLNEKSAPCRPQREFVQFPVRTVIYTSIRSLRKTLVFSYSFGNGMGVIMKTIFSVLFLLFCQSSFGMEIDKRLSGSWYNPVQDGHGINVEVLNDNKTVVYWYVYHTDGTPMFLTTVGTNTGDTTAGTTKYHTGMQFGSFNPIDRQQIPWGTASVTFHDCTNATLQYQADDPAYGGGTIPMERLTFVHGLKCSDSPLHGTYYTSLVEFMTGQVAMGVALFFEHGDLFYMAGGNLDALSGAGNWYMTDDKAFSFNANTYSTGGAAAGISGSGIYDEDNLMADYTGLGQLLATPAASFQRGLSTSKLAGTYFIVDYFTPSGFGSATVASDGAVSGTTNDGCDINGRFEVPNALFNQAYMNLEVVNCPNARQITGAATYDKDRQSILAMSNDGQSGYIWSFNP